MAAVAFVPAQTQLADLAKLARQRAERARPAQQQALEPFWQHLELDYRINQQHLDPKIAEVAALGGSVVPLLIEKLQPAQGSEKERSIASNCRRVLERLDPASFVDALAELANGTNETGRAEAIRLLGVANTTQATMLLIDLLERTTGEDRRLVLRSLKQQKAPQAAPKIVGMLGSADRQVREDVLGYLIAAHPSQVADTVAQALAAERDSKLLPLYVEYFQAAVRSHEGAARALLPLLDRERLAWQDTKLLVTALGTIAPQNHEPTCKRLHELIDSGETSSLGVQAALSLRSLGDTRGVPKLKRSLDEQLRKPQRKKEATLYEQRGGLLMGIEEYADAYADFEKMLENSSNEGAMSRRAYAGMMRCEARRKRVANLTKLMKASAMSISEIESIGAEDAVFQETLQQDKVRQFLQSLAKELGGK